MIKVEPFSTQGVYDTLLELRLQDWAHEQDPEVTTPFTFSHLAFTFIHLADTLIQSDISLRKVLASPLELTPFQIHLLYFLPYLAFLELFLFALIFLSCLAEEESSPGGSSVFAEE